MHNLQPSKDYNYRVDPCNPLSCSYTSVIYEIDKIKNSSKCDSPDCGYKRSIDSIALDGVCSNVMVHFIDDEDYFKVEELKVEGVIDSASDLIFYGMEHVEKIRDS